MISIFRTRVEKEKSSHGILKPMALISWTENLDVSLFPLMVLKGGIYLGSMWTPKN